MRLPATTRMITIGRLVAYQISSAHWKDLRNAWERRRTPGKKSKQFTGKQGNIFAVDTDNFTVSARKLIIAVPSNPFEEISGDVAADIKRNVYFEAILPDYSFKAVTVYTVILGGKTLLSFTA